MGNDQTKPTEIPQADLAVVADLYHRFLTGLLLALASRAGAARGAAVVFRAFRRQQEQNSWTA